MCLLDYVVRTQYSRETLIKIFDCVKRGETNFDSIINDEYLQVVIEVIKSYYYNKRNEFDYVMNLINS